MAMRIEWTPRANLHLNLLVAEGREFFGERVTNKFVRHLYKEVLLLEMFPYMGKVEPYLSHLSEVYRSLVVHRHYKLVYRYIFRPLPLWVP